jgi:hypothetical protein
VVTRASQKCFPFSSPRRCYSARTSAIFLDPHPRLCHIINKKDLQARANRHKTKTPGDHRKRRHQILKRKKEKNKNNIQETTGPASGIPYAQTRRKEPETRKQGNKVSGHTKTAKAMDKTMDQKDQKDPILQEKASGKGDTKTNTEQPTSIYGSITPCATILIHPYDATNKNQNRGKRKVLRQTKKSSQLKPTPHVQSIRFCRLAYEWQQLDTRTQTTG